MPFLIALGVLAVLVIVVLFLTLFTVEQQTAAVIERFGKFQRIAGSGLNVKVPFIDRVAGRVNLRVQQLDVRVETKTKDNVFVHVLVSVQFVVQPNQVYDAFYRLSAPGQQITAFVFDTVRARVPNIELDSVFEHKDDIANAVREELADVMDEFGYRIVKALVTDIDPDKRVKDAMNEINAAKRIREAAVERGEADKILKVKAAEAEAESKALQGKGIADQRRAIIDGLRESVDEFAQAIPGTSAEGIMQLVLMTQHYDTMKDIGATSRSTVVFAPYSPGGMRSLAAEMREAIIGGNAAADAIDLDDDDPQPPRQLRRPSSSATQGPPAPQFPVERPPTEPREGF